MFYGCRHAVRHRQKVIWGGNTSSDRGGCRWDAMVVIAILFWLWFLVSVVILVRRSILRRRDRRMLAAPRCNSRCTTPPPSDSDADAVEAANRRDRAAGSRTGACRRRPFPPPAPRAPHPSPHRRARTGRRRTRPRCVERRDDRAGGRRTGDRRTGDRRHRDAVRVGAAHLVRSRHALRPWAASPLLHDARARRCRRRPLSPKNSNASGSR